LHPDNGQLFWADTKAVRKKMTKILFAAAAALLTAQVAGAATFTITSDVGTIRDTSGNFLEFEGRTIQYTADLGDPGDADSSSIASDGPSFTFSNDPFAGIARATITIDGGLGTEEVREAFEVTTTFQDDFVIPAGLPPEFASVAAFEGGTYDVIGIESDFFQFTGATFAAVGGFFAFYDQSTFSTSGGTVTPNAFPTGNPLGFLFQLQDYTLDQGGAPDTDNGSEGQLYATLTFDGPEGAIPVPLPAPVMLLGAGLLGLGAASRRRRKA
jgi:hypothetical protein